MTTLIILPNKPGEESEKLLSHAPPGDIITVRKPKSVMSLMKQHGIRPKIVPAGGTGVLSPSHIETLAAIQLDQAIVVNDGLPETYSLIEQLRRSGTPVEVIPANTKKDTGQEYNCGPGLHEWYTADGTTHTCRICYRTYKEKRTRDTTLDPSGSAPSHVLTKLAPEGEPKWMPQYPDGKFPPFYRDEETDDLFV